MPPAITLLHARFVAQVPACPRGTTDPESNCVNLPQVTANSQNLEKILQIVFGIIGAVAVIFIILSALKFITAQGDPQALAKARQSIIYAAIGLAVAVSAVAAVTLLLGRV